MSCSNLIILIEASYPRLGLDNLSIPVFLEPHIDTRLGFIAKVGTLEVILAWVIHWDTESLPHGFHIHILLATV